ncbi:ChaN family lipoprotein [Sphaerotilus sp.]|uniref:ChaN family lipoprotein n=1 Tax=Sphaerotilus sp. TaxID=2093942 RepID=UPI002ACD2FAA|nr:ChaN family lipoprotein [Sphaerotilus sp.]MDZ7855864.1 ChaN family lipoprotein [Sphaerotilus sp.]
MPTVASAPQVLPALLALGLALFACTALALAGERVQHALFGRSLTPARRRLVRCAALACLAGASLGGGWAVAGAPLVDLLTTTAPRPLVLLGEVHDNAQQHALRLQAFEALLASGARPALLMEQFDRERQADLDRSRAQPGANADALIAAAATAGARWHWPFYKPFIALALQNGLPIVAANVSRADARRVVAEGLQAMRFDERVPPDITAAQAEIIVASHCGAVDAAQGLRMAAAQVARDQFMASLVERYAERGVVLLAGNGHVRRDIGVPRWLGAPLRSRVLAIGLLEEGDDSHAAYDRTLTTPRQPREDPCAALRPAPRPAGATT